MVLQRLRRVLGRVVRPQRVDEAVDAHDPAPGQGESGEQGASAGAGHPDLRAVHPDGQRTEDAHPYLWCRGLRVHAASVCRSGRGHGIGEPLDRDPGREPVQADGLDQAGGLRRLRLQRRHLASQRGRVEDEPQGQLVGLAHPRLAELEDPEVLVELGVDAVLRGGDGVQQPGLPRRCGRVRGRPSGSPSGGPGAR